MKMTIDYYVHYLDLNITVKTYSHKPFTDGGLFLTIHEVYTV